MQLKKQCFIFLSLLFMVLSSKFSAAETFYIGGNESPLVLETEDFEDQTDTIEIKGALVLNTGLIEIVLSNVEGSLWDYNEEKDEYESFEFEVNAQDFFSQLYDSDSFFSMQKRISIKLRLVEGNLIETRIPLDSKRKYFLIEGMAGEYFNLGLLNFEIPKFQLETQLGLSIDDTALFFTGNLSGLGAFISPVSMAGFGIARNKVFKFVPKTTFEVDAGDMTFSGQTAIIGTAKIPYLPVALTGELVTQYEGPLMEQRKLGFNGELEASYKFSGELGLSLHLGNASGMLKKPTLAGSRRDAELIFSGMQDPKFSFLPEGFPLQPGNKVKIAGRMSSSLERSYIVVNTDFTVLNIPMSQGRMRVDKNGLIASGYWKTPISKLSFSGQVAKKKIDLRGKAQAKLDISGIVEKVEFITNGAVCGYNFAQNGAKCGYDFVFSGIGCSVAKLTLTKCQKQCRLTNIGGPRMPSRWSCEMSCFNRVKANCKKTRKCKFPKRCKRVVKIPNQNLGHISADIALLISNSGLGGSVNASFCPLKKKCAKLPAGKVRLDVSNIKKPKVCISKGVGGSSKGLCVGI